MEMSLEALWDTYYMHTLFVKCTPNTNCHPYTHVHIYGNINADKYYC